MAQQSVANLTDFNAAITTFNGTPSPDTINLTASIATTAGFTATTTEFEFTNTGGDIDFEGSWSLGAATTIAVPIELTGASTLTIGGATTISGVLSGAGALTKAGAATLTLSGTNTYSGGTTISAGTINTSTAASLGGAGAVTLSTGGALNATASYTDAHLTEDTTKVMVNATTPLGKSGTSYWFFDASGEIVSLSARALGHLARAGGALTADFVEFEAKRALEWLQVVEPRIGRVLLANGYRATVIDLDHDQDAVAHDTVDPGIERHLGQGREASGTLSGDGGRRRRVGLVLPPRAHVADDVQYLP